MPRLAAIHRDRGGTDNKGARRSGLRRSLIGIFDRTAVGLSTIPAWPLAILGMFRPVRFLVLLGALAGAPKPDAAALEPALAFMLFVTFIQVPLAAPGHNGRHSTRFARARFCKTA
ncbi:MULTISPECIES: hypothetical protein [unclassified Sphingopyxis]|uniref:hypothetical protein n=1 Tax=unclassified Sphingopyxis TaxID=2614943 RepID=UPI003012BF00